MGVWRSIYRLRAYSVLPESWHIHPGATIYPGKHPYPELINRCGQCWSVLGSKWKILLASPLPTKNKNAYRYPRPGPKPRARGAGVPWLPQSHVLSSYKNFRKKFSQSPSTFRCKICPYRKAGVKNFRKIYKDASLIFLSGLTTDPVSWDFRHRKKSMGIALADPGISKTIYWTFLCIWV